MADENLAQNAGMVFRFCAQSMRYPDSQWFTDEYCNGLYLLLDALDAAQERQDIDSTFADAGFLERLQAEYTRLFINAAPHVIAPPYGSVYKNHSLGGQYTEDIHLFYRRHGYDLREKSDFADNIVYQLEFLSCIAQQGEDDIQREFLSCFFFPWFGEFSRRVKEEAELPFYPVIISLIDFFTKEEEKYGI